MRKYCFHFSSLFSYDKFFNQSCNCTVEHIFLFMCELRSEGDFTHLWACEVLFGILSHGLIGRVFVRVNFSLWKKKGEHLIITLVITEQEPLQY